MSNPDFRIKLGKSRAARRRKEGRVALRIVKAAALHRAPKSHWANALTRRPVAELARGKGAIYGLLPPQPGWRRVIVKARIARHGTSDLAAARSHQHYLMRDGVTPEGGSGQLYDRCNDRVDGGDFLERQKGDTYQFRFIIAPEDSGRMAELKPFVRDLMASMERDLHTKLDWVAVDHFNTGHPHTHVIIAGHDDHGKDLVMARHYISHGIRHRARDLVTLELGPELEFERAIKRANEVNAERLTSLDRGILNDAKDHILVVSARVDGDRQRAPWRVGRLRRLDLMGLAEEKQAGVWAIDPQLEAKLRSMGERGDIMVTMHKTMRRHGIDRSAGDFAIFAGARKAEPVIGRVVEVGIADEMTERKYLVIDGTDGRIFYAETSTLAADDVPDTGMIVALTGGGGKAKMRNAQVEILSYWPIDRLTAADAATWLDKVILADKKPAIHDKGFGADVSKAIMAREEWLIAQGLARTGGNNTITPEQGLLRTLSSRGFSGVAEKVSEELVMQHFALDGMPFKGRHIRTIDLPDRRLAVIKGRNEFALLPWRAEFARLRGKEIAIAVHDRAITLSIARGRGRDLGLSR
jgi:type IV secretory pathway VirD2 relaxase